MQYSLFCGHLGLSDCRDLLTIQFCRVMEGSVVLFDSSTGAKGWRQKANAKEWRLFMSPRVSDTLRDAAPGRSSSNDDKLQEQEFKKIHKEVEQLGTSQMSWKEQKAVEAKKILALGAKPEKGHKMPIAMGMNIKRKREKIVEQKLQEDIFTGMRPAKRGRKMNEKRSTENRGLKASEGVFKGGVLYVKPFVMKEADRVGHKSIYPGEERKGKGKPGKKGKSKKHKGKRKRR